MWSYDWVPLQKLRDVIMIEFKIEMVSVASMPALEQAKQQGHLESALKFCGAC